jgi:hypothetical protein
MQQKELLTEHPGFLEEDFRKDLETLFSVPDSVIEALTSHFTQIQDYDDLVDAKKWVEVAEKTKLTIDELFRMSRPLRYICMIALREGVEVEQIISLLGEAGVLRSEEIPKQQRILQLSSALQPIANAAEGRMLPMLPGLRIQGLSSSANVISQFENDFDSSTDDPLTYHPRIRRLHVYTIVQLRFRGDDNRQVTIALSEEHLKQLIRHLQLAQVQHRALEVRVKAQAAATVEKE